jgi:hypothetical protein
MSLVSEPIAAIRNCRWIDVPGVADARGQVNFAELGKALPFAPKRLFWLHHGCRVELDDGRNKQQVRLDDPTRALHLGTWVWHELVDFTPQTVVLVIASTLYDEAEYLRDYETFQREAAARP